jgi:hypothetical protein
VFPHANDAGYCGGEVRNKNFKGFMKDGTRGLAASKDSQGDTTLFFTEVFMDNGEVRAG